MRAQRPRYACLALLVAGLVVATALPGAAARAGAVQRSPAPSTNARRLLAHPHGAARTAPGQHSSAPGNGQTCHRGTTGTALSSGRTGKDTAQSVACPTHSAPAPRAAVVTAITPRSAAPSHLITVHGTFPSRRPSQATIQFFGAGPPRIARIGTWTGRAVTLRVPADLTAGNYWLIFSWRDPRTGATVTSTTAPLYVRVTGHVYPVVIRSTTVVLTRATLQHLLLPPATRTLDVSHPNLLLVFNGVTPQLRSVKIGDVVAAGSAPVTPYGLLRKIKSITRQGSLLILAVVPATLREALVQGTIEIHGAIGASRVSHVSPHVATRSVTRRSDRYGFTVGRCMDILNVDLLKAGNDGLNGRITLNGQVCLSGTFDLNVSVPPCRLLFSGCNTPVRASFAFNGTQSSHLSLKAGATAKISKETTVFDYNLCHHDPSFCFTGLVGGFPVEASPVLRLIVGGDGHASVGLTVGVGQSSSLQAGIYCQDTSCSASATAGRNMTLDADYAVHADADATIYADPHVAVLLYDAAGPDLELHAYVHAQFDAAATPCWTVDAGLQDLIGLRLKVGTYEWDKSIPWAGITTRLGQGTCTSTPNATATPNPGSGSGPSPTVAPVPSPVPVNPTSVPPAASGDVSVVSMSPQGDSESSGTSFHPNVVVQTSGFSLNCSQDFLESTGDNRYSAWPNNGCTDLGNSHYQFYYNTPMVAPNDSGTYHSHWQVWHYPNHIGPVIDLWFVVPAPPPPPTATGAPLPTTTPSPLPTTAPTSQPTALPTPASTAVSTMPVPPATAIPSAIGTSVPPATTTVTTTVPTNTPTSMPSPTPSPTMLSGNLAPQAHRDPGGSDAAVDGRLSCPCGTPPRMKIGQSRVGRLC